MKKILLFFIILANVVCSQTISWTTISSRIHDSTATTLRISKNLSDLANTATARINLGVYSTGAVDSFLGTKLDTTKATALLRSQWSTAYNRSISVANDSTNWNTAYTDRMKWDGGATGLVAATGRTSLGLGTMALVDSVLFRAEMAGLYVPLSRTVNGKALTSNISLAYSDLTSSAINIGTDAITSGAITSNSGFIQSSTTGGITNGFKFGAVGNRVALYDDGSGNPYVDAAIGSNTNVPIYFRTKGGGSFNFVNGSVFVGYSSDPTSGNKFAVNGNSYFNGTGTFTGLLTGNAGFSFQGFSKDNNSGSNYIALNRSDNTTQDNVLSWQTNNVSQWIVGSGISYGGGEKFVIRYAPTPANALTFDTDLSATFAGSGTFGGSLLSSQSGSTDITARSTSSGWAQFIADRPSTARFNGMILETATTVTWAIGQLYNAGGATTDFSIGTSTSLSDAKVTVVSDGNVNFVLGAVSIGTQTVAGTIKYATGHFYGYNGSTWLQLDN